MQNNKEVVSGAVDELQNINYAAKVYGAMTEKAKHRTSADNVCDVLNAIAALQPAQTATLTDEQIRSIANDHGWSGAIGKLYFPDDALVDFARALLSHPAAPPIECCGKMETQAGNMVCCGEPVEVAPAQRDIYAFESLAKYQGLQDFTKAADKAKDGEIPSTHGGKFSPATYYNFITELAYRVWANKAVATAQPTTALSGEQLITIDSQEFSRLLCRYGDVALAEHGTVDEWQAARDALVAHIDARLAALSAPAAQQPITYTVDGEVMSPLEYINYLHEKLAAQQPVGYFHSHKYGSSEIIEHVHESAAGDDGVFPLCACAQQTSETAIHNAAIGAAREYVIGRQAGRSLACAEWHEIGKIYRGMESLLRPAAQEAEYKPDDVLLAAVNAPEVDFIGTVRASLGAQEAEKPHPAEVERMLDADEEADREQPEPNAVDDWLAGAEGLLARGQAAKGGKE